MKELLKPGNIYYYPDNYPKEETYELFALIGRFKIYKHRVTLNDSNGNEVCVVWDDNLDSNKTNIYGNQCMNQCMTNGGTFNTLRGQLAIGKIYDKALTLKITSKLSEDDYYMIANPPVMWLSNNTVTTCFYHFVPIKLFHNSEHPVIEKLPCSDKCYRYLNKSLEEHRNKLLSFDSFLLEEVNVSLPVIISQSTLPSEWGHINYRFDRSRSKIDSETHTKLSDILKINYLSELIDELNGNFSWSKEVNA